MPPVNDNVVDATLISPVLGGGPTTLTGQTTVAATTESSPLGGESAFWGYDPPSVWYRIELPESESPPIMTVGISNADYKYYAEIYRPDVEPPANVDDVFNGNFFGSIGLGTTGDDSEIDTYVSEDAIYVYVGNWDWDADVGTFDISITVTQGPPGNDARLAADDNANVGNLGWWTTDIFWDDGAPEEFGPAFYFNSNRCLPGTTIGATADTAPAILGFPATRNVWFAFSAVDAGTYRFTVEARGTSPVLDPLLAIYDWTTGVLGAQLAVDDDSGPGLYPQIDLALIDGQKIAIEVDSRDAGQFTIFVRKLAVGASPANDDFANAEVIVPGVGFSGTTVDATGECGETPVAGAWSGPYNSVWFTYTPDYTGLASIELTTGATPGGFDLLVDIYVGSTLETLENRTEAFNFQTNFYNETINVPYMGVNGTPIYIRVSGLENEEATFSGEVTVQSTTPPPNDDFDDAEVIPPGSGGGIGGSEHTIPGSTDGSTVEDGEIDPWLGGIAPDGSGSVWYTYTAPAPGFLTIYTDSAETAQHWPYVHVWEGTARDSMLVVRPLSLHPRAFPSGFGYTRSHYEIREGETYKIQIFRRPEQLWGDFDLHVIENLEEIDWEYTVDGFDSTTGGPDFSPTDPDADMEVEGQIEYGTFDAGGPAPKWNRAFTVNLEIKCLGGGVLVRHGGEESPFTDPTKKNRRLGIFRIRDVDDVARWHLYLQPGTDGQNRLAFGAEGNLAEISIGDSPKDDLGWVKIEMQFFALNRQIATSTSTVTWELRYVHIDNKIHPVGSSFVSKRFQYFDFGFWRYSDQTTAVEAQAEDVENWIIAYRRMAVTNIVPREPYDFDADSTIGEDELKVTQFDGFAGGASWHNTLHNWTTPSVEGTFEVKDQGGSDVLATAYLPIEEAPWDATKFAVHMVDPGGYPSLISYDGQWGSRRWYGFWFQADQFPVVNLGTAGSEKTGIAGYTLTFQGGSGLATLTLSEEGELRLFPYLLPDFCVAFLEEGVPYWIVVMLDAEVMWDVKVRVWINNSYFGEYSNKRDWAWLAAFPDTASQERDVYGQAFETQAHSLINNVKFGQAESSILATYLDHDLWYTGFTTGRGNLYDGHPLTTRIRDGVDAEGDHSIPSVPSESVYLRAVRNGVGGTMEDKAFRIYGWDVEDGPASQSTPWPPPGPDTGPVSNTTRSFTTPLTAGVLGDQVLAVCMASAGGGTLVGAAQEWDPGGAGGSIEPTNTHLTVTLTGTPQQVWSTCVPFWVATLGTGVIPRLQWGGGSGTLLLTDYRLLQNPLVYPRFTYTDDDGASYTWIEPGEADSASRIGADIRIDNSTEAVYTDTSGALTRLQVNDGQITGHGISAHHANNMPYHYLEYSTPGTDEEVVYAVNLWARFKGHWGPPRDDPTLYDGQFVAKFALDDGSKRLGTYNNRAIGVIGNIMGSSAADLAVIDRHVALRAPDGTRWNPSNIPEVMLRLGFHNVILTDNHDYELNTDSFAYQSDQRSGAKIFQLSTEFLIDGTEYDPPPGCHTIVSMNYRIADRSGVATRVLVGD